MNRRVVLAVLVFVILVFTHPSFSQSTEDIKALKEDIKVLKEGQKLILMDIQEIKKLLQTKQAPHASAEFKEAIINIEDAHSKGDKNAKLALVEFSDYQ
jgi:Tfp pilus assembly protein PilN